MNGIRTKRWHRWALATMGAWAITAASCSDNTTPATAASVNYAYDDYYLYSAYYPADVAYAGYYYADSWYYPSFYYAAAYGPGAGNPSGTAGTTGSAGTTGTAGTGGTTGTSAAAGSSGTAGTSGSTVATAHTTLATVIEALARGQDVCPGQVTVTPKWATPACAGGTATQERNGVTISFNGCRASGQIIDGMFDVQSNRSASDQTCSSTTTITLGHTTTVTNLSISGPNGKIVIPSHTDTATATYTYGQSPASLSITDMNGELQIFNAAGTMVSDLAYTGTDNFTFSGNTSYSADGSSTIQEKDGSATASITKMGVTRSGGCCRPTGGTVTVNRSGGIAPGQANWTFGPSCGQVTRNNVNVTLPDCI